MSAAAQMQDDLPSQQQQQQQQPQSIPADAPVDSLMKDGVFDIKIVLPKVSKIPYVEMPVQQIQAREFMDHCITKSVISTVMGGVFGFAIGGFFAMMDQGMAVPGQSQFGLSEKQRKMGALETVKDMGRTIGTRGMSNAKSFAVIGGLFAGTECVVSSYRGKDDMKNSLAAGCMTGGGLGLRAGAKSAMFGCVGFMAFSAAVDHFFIRKV